MELLDQNLLSAFATILVVCALFSLILTVVVWSIAGSRANLLPVLVSAFAFSLLGVVTGSIMAHSRESAVAAVLPAVLTLLGGVLIYLIGTKGHDKQASVSCLVICFAGSLYVGSSYGSRLRYDFETAITNPVFLRARELGLEENRHAVEVQRLLNYIQLQKLQRDFAKSEGLDLSGFQQTLQRGEKPTDTKVIKPFN